MIWFDNVTKRFWLCKLGLSSTFEYICSAPSHKIVKRYLLTLLLLLAFRTGFSQTALPTDSLIIHAEPAWMNVGIGLTAFGDLNLAFSSRLSKMNYYDVQSQIDSQGDEYYPASPALRVNLGLLFSIPHAENR